MNKRQDIIVTLTKYDLPSDDSFVALGHFDKIQFTRVKSNNEFFQFKENINLSPYINNNQSENTTKDMEGMLRNYLIASEYGDDSLKDELPFRFMVTISIRRQEKNDKGLDYYAEKLSSRLYAHIKEHKNIQSDLNTLFNVFYPISRGDIIILVDSNYFAESIKLLYDFVYYNEYVLASYTIPMMSQHWLSDMNPCNHSDCGLKIRLRTTVKGYQQLYDFIYEKFPSVSSNLAISVSVGAEDVIVDFGEFNEKKLHSIICIIASPDVQQTYRDSIVLSAETDTPIAIQPQILKVKNDICIEANKDTQIAYESSDCTDMNYQLREYIKSSDDGVRISIGNREAIAFYDKSDSIIVRTSEAFTAEKGKLIKLYNNRNYSENDTNEKYAALIKSINSVFSITEDVCKQLIAIEFNTNELDNWKEELRELKVIFFSQASALNKIIEASFFPAISSSFYEAFKTFISLAENAKERIKSTLDPKVKGSNEDRIREIKVIHYKIKEDSSFFIKSFDDALQGYLNSDRQFMEFPGHRVSLYDLPVKLGVVYINFIDKMTNSFEKDNTERYLLCPAPPTSDGEKVVPMLHQYGMKEHLYIIQVPVALLFKPQNLCIIIAHEIMHNACRKNRILVINGESMRNKYIVQSVVEEIGNIVCDELFRELSKLSRPSKKIIADITKDIKANVETDINTLNNILKLNDSKEESLFSNVPTQSEIKDLLISFYVGNGKCLHLIMKSVNDIISKHQLTLECAYLLTPNRVQRMFDVLDHETYDTTSISLNTEYCIMLICYLYKECTADVQAIKLLHISAEDYIPLIKKTYDAKWDYMRSFIRIRAWVVCAFMCAIDDKNKNSSWNEKAMSELENTFAITGEMQDSSVTVNKWYLKKTGNSAKRLFHYLETVYTTMDHDSSVENKAVIMYNEIIKASKNEQITSTLIKYML